MSSIHFLGVFQEYSLKLLWRSGFLHKMFLLPGCSFVFACAVGMGVGTEKLIFR